MKNLLQKKLKQILKNKFLKNWGKSENVFEKKQAKKLHKFGKI